MLECIEGVQSIQLLDSLEQNTEQKNELHVREHKEKWIGRPAVKKNVVLE